MKPKFNIGDIVHMEVRGMKVIGIEAKDGKHIYKITDAAGYVIENVDEFDLIEEESPRYFEKGVENDGVPSRFLCDM